MADDAVIPLSVYLEAQKQTAEAIIGTARDTAEIRATMLEISETIKASAAAEEVARARWDVFLRLPAVTALVVGIAIGGVVVFATYPALLRSGLIAAAEQAVVP